MAKRRKGKKIKMNPEQEAALNKMLLLLQNDFNARHGIPLLTSLDDKKQ